MKQSEDFHPHEIYPHVKHVCYKCEKQCVKENDKQMPCEKVLWEAELSAEIGKEVKL